MAKKPFTSRCEPKSFERRAYGPASERTPEMDILLARSLGVRFFDVEDVKNYRTALATWVEAHGPAIEELCRKLAQGHYSDLQKRSIDKLLKDEIAPAWEKVKQFDGPSCPPDEDLANMFKLTKHYFNEGLSGLRNVAERAPGIKNRDYVEMLDAAIEDYQIWLRPLEDNVEKRVRSYTPSQCESRHYEPDAYRAPNSGLHK